MREPHLPEIRLDNFRAEIFFIRFGKKTTLGRKNSHKKGGGFKKKIPIDCAYIGDFA